MGPVFSDRQRSDASPRTVESQYAFLDRIAGPYWDRIRRLIDAWAAGYSPADRTDMVRRLQSDDDLQFLGAYWELLLFHGLGAMGFQVSCHPEVAGVSTRPDFLVQGDQCSTYVEAKVLGDGRAAMQQAKRRADVENGLNSRVRSDEIMVQLVFKKQGAHPIPISRLAADTKAWLRQLDIEAVRNRVPTALSVEPHSFAWTDERSGWSLVLNPMVRRKSYRDARFVAISGPLAGFINDRTPIRRALYEKAHKYGNQLDRPLVVALAIAREFADDTDMMDTLFGSDVYMIDPVSGDGRPGRLMDGLMIGPMGPRSRRLSAVLVSRDLLPHLAARTTLALWRNPWADYPVRWDGGGVLATVEPRDDGSLATIPATTSTGELLGLPADWPGPEKPFTRN